MIEADRSVSFQGIFIWFIVAFFFLYEFFLRTFIGSIAHQVIRDFRLTIEQFSLVGSAYYLAYGLMQMPVGILSDKFGVKRIMVFATLVCAAATFLFVHSDGFTDALISRFLMGFGSSFAFICLLVVASNWFPARFFGLFAGMSQFVGMMGPALAGGPLISWLIRSHVKWQHALSSIGAIGVVLALLSLLFVKGKPKEGRENITYLTLTASSLEKLKHLLRSKQAWVVALYSAGVYLPIAVMAAAWGTDFLQSVGLQQKTAAYMISISWLAYAVGCPFFGFLSDISSRRKPYLLFCAVLGVFSMTGILFCGSTSPWVYEILFFGMGLACSGQNIGFAAIAEHTRPEIKATSLGLNNASMTITCAVVPVLIGYLISFSSGSSDAEHLQKQDFILGLSVLILSFAISTILSAFAFKETYCKSQKSVVLLKR